MIRPYDPNAIKAVTMAMPGLSPQSIELRDSIYHQPRGMIQSFSPTAPANASSIGWIVVRFSFSAA